MDILLDTSWSLSYASTSSIAYRNLFSASTTQDHLNRYFGRLPQFLSSQKPQYVDDLNNESEKLGSFRECKHTITSLPHISGALRSRTDTQLIQVQLIYQHTTFTFLLHTPHLILSKATASHSKHFMTFLSDTFSISVDPLKLPSSFLCESLQSYITTLTGNIDDPADELNAEQRAAILRAAIGTLKLTISFSGPVSPHLRNMDLSVPYESVESLMTASRGKSFAETLAEYVHLHTGLKLPLSYGATIFEVENEVSTTGHAGSVSSESVIDATLRLSKMAAAAFAVSIEGRLRFAARAIDNAVDQEDMIVAGNISVLDGIVQEAMRLSAATNGG